MTIVGERFPSIPFLPTSPSAASRRGSPSRRRGVDRARPAGARGRADPDPRRQRRRRNRVRRHRDAARDRAPPGRQPRFRCRGQPLCHVQRGTRSAATGFRCSSEPDGARVPFVTDRRIATSMAFDRDGRLHVSSRFDGSVHQVDARGRSKVVATDLGVACGIAFGPGGELYVGDRSGSILRVSGERTDIIASLPPSVAAFHLAFGPDGHLYVAAPTISSSDGLYRVVSRRRGRALWRAVRPAAGHRLRCRGTALRRGRARRQLRPVQARSRASDRGRTVLPAARSSGWRSRREAVWSWRRTTPSIASTSAPRPMFG